MATKRASKLHLLTVREVQTAGDGNHSDGGGLMLRVRGDSAIWVLRYTALTGRRREMSLGAARRSNSAQAGTGLAAARDLAHAARDLLQRGVDPIDERDQRRSASREAEEIKKADQARERTTLARVARRYHADMVEPQRTKKHAAQWIASLELNLPPAIWHAPIDSIEPAELLSALADLRKRVPETCDRVRQRLETIFDDAEFHKLCTGNPARAIRRKLAERPRGKAKGNFAALPYAEVPAFMRQLRQQPGVAARCLEFALLTAARTGEVLGCTWDEIDAQAGTWRIPGSRMKGGEEHVVYLCPRALEIVESMRMFQGEPWVFPSPVDREKAMSNMAMLVLLKRMGYADNTTVHGVCRASFSSWANDTGATRPDVIEACLAHREADKVRASYNRAQFNAERKALLEAWANFLAHSAQITPIRVLQQKDEVEASTDLRQVGRTECANT
jgi:integrase